MTHLRPIWLPLGFSTWTLGRLLWQLHAINLLRGIIIIRFCYFPTRTLCRTNWLRQPWVRIHGPNGIRSNACEWRLLDFFLSTKPILTTDFQPRQRVVHTQLFKLIEVGEGPHRRSELWISEADWQGCERLRHPEHFFHGIVGHVRTNGAIPSMDGVKLPDLPSIGAATSKSKRVHTIIIRLSRMRNKRTISSLPIQLMMKWLMTMRMTPLPWESLLKLQIKSYRCPCRSARWHASHTMC